MIRQAQPQDAEQLAYLAEQSVRKRSVPLPVSRPRVGAMVRHGISDPHSFFWVAIAGNGLIVASLGALVHNGFWFEGQQASVLLYFSELPDEGIKLIRKFRDWVKARPEIKLAVFSLESNSDPRIAKLLRRCGFTLECPQMVLLQGVVPCPVS